MIIPLLITIAIAAVIALDLVKDTEFTAIAVLTIVIYATIYGFQEYYFAVLAVLLKPMIYNLIRRDIVKSLGLKLAIAPYIPTLMYLLSGMTFGYIAQKIVIPLLDFWASRVLFTLLIFLALYLTIAPSLTTLSMPMILLIFNIDTLGKALYWLSIFFGTIISIYMVIEVGVYMIIPLILALILVYYRKRLGVLGKHIIPIIFFIIVLTLSLVIV